MSKIAVTRTALVLAWGALAAAAAGAQGMVNARVLSANPVWQQVPVSDCGPNPGAVRPGGAGTALGALVGGLLGSQVGGGSGRIAGAMLGTVGGALLGNAAETQGGYYGCGTRYENRVTGYDVSYDLGGRQYRTRMAQAPGAWIQVPAPDGYGYADPAYGAQGYPVNPAPVAGYPLPAYPAAGESSGVVTAPPAVYGGGGRIRIRRRATRRPIRQLIHRFIHRLIPRRSTRRPATPTRWPRSTCGRRRCMRPRSASTCRSAACSAATGAVAAGAWVSARASDGRARRPCKLYF